MSEQLLDDEGRRSLHLDQAGLAGEPGPEEQAFDFHDGLHTETLFDEDEARNGDLIDPATGLPYDNSTERYDDIHIVEESSDWDSLTEAEVLELAADPDRLRALVEQEARAGNLGRTANSGIKPRTASERHRSGLQS